MIRLLECIIAGLIVLTFGIGILARYSKREDPSETEEGKVIKLDDHEYKISGDEYPPLKKVQEN